MTILFTMNLGDAWGAVAPPGPFATSTQVKRPILRFAWLSK